MTRSGEIFAGRVRAYREYFARVSAERRSYDQAFLRAFLEAHRDTSFGRDHDFASIGDLETFRRRVPIRRYEELEPWVRRAANGEDAVLSKERPFVFRRTSGTTASSKLIPVTPTSCALDVKWLTLLFAAVPLKYPEAMARPNAILNTCPTRPGPIEVTAGGTPWRSYSEHMFERQMVGEGGVLQGMPGSEAPFWDLGRPMSVDELAYARLRSTATANLLGVMAVNPSSLVALNTFFEANVARLISEIGDGTCFGTAYAPPAPEIARQIERRVSDAGATLSAVWPDLRFAITWKTANCSLYLPRLKKIFGEQVEILPLPYCASDGITAVHLDDHPTAGFLIPDQVLLEFVPADQDVRSDSRAVLPPDLEIGAQYYAVFTSWNGLTRYAIGDLFQVLERVDGVPRLEFVGREGSSSFTGEKLTDQQVVSSVRATLSRFGVVIENFTCLPVWGSPPHYLFVLEMSAGSPATAPEALAAELDVQLGKHNDEYPGKRKSHRLGPAEILVAGPRTFQRYRHALLERKVATPAQMKDRAIEKDPGRSELLLELARKGHDPG